MCLVIDANCFGLVFGKNLKFAPVWSWIYEGRGRMIYGGTKYNKELAAWGMLPLLKELSGGRRIVHIPNATVDAIAKALKLKFPEDIFDDEHIVALVIASRCRVVCTNDNPAIQYLKRLDVFADSGVERPKIFRGHRSHIDLCCNENIVAACRGQA